MRVLVLHDEPVPGARPDELDTLAQAEAIAAALRANGHAVELAPCGLDLRALLADLERRRPDVVCNLVESVARSGRLAHLPAQVLEHAGMPFTGGGGAALFTSNGKLLAKAILAAHGLPTPPAFALAELQAGPAVPPGPWLVKAVWEHGSLGIDDTSVIASDDPAVLAAAVRARAPGLGGEAFVERYVHGREFNVALLEVDGVPRCLPVAEIRFAAAFAGRPHLVGYRAKWDDGSADARDTVRCFGAAAAAAGGAEAGLHAALVRDALAAWQAFGISGYARIDFRVDEGGQPWVIDVNVNPCLAPDAGFAATLAAAGIAYGDALEHLLRAALRRAGRAP
jgi:D-alanine-D-alanine ligase